MVGTQGKARKGFTLVELLVVIGIIALLVSVLLPVLGKARSRATNVKCMSQLRNIGQAVMMYANENKGKVPQHGSDALWLWDIAKPTRDALIRTREEQATKGGSRDVLYCPTFYEQNVEDLWNGTFGGVAPPGRNFAVIGYIWLGRRTTTADPKITSGNLPDLNGRSYVEMIGKMPPKPKLLPTLAPRATAEVELATDAIVGQTDNTGKFTWSAKGGWSDWHVSSHLIKGVPEGANVLFLDGHVSFRPYKAVPKANDDVLRRRGKWGSPNQIEFWF